MKTLTILLFLPFLTAHAGGKTDSLGDIDITANPAAVSNSDASANSASNASANVSGQVSGTFDNAGNLSNSTDYVNIGLSMVGPAPASVTDCYIPRKKLGRGFRFLFGAVEMSAVVERDEDCITDREVAHTRYLERVEAQARLMEAEAERDRAAIQRMEAERQVFEGDRK